MRSSLSRTLIHSPLAISRARLRAAAGPPLTSDLTRRIRSSSAIRLSTIPTLESVDAVIGNDDLNVANSLTTCRTNSVGNELLAVIICDNHTDVDYRLSAVLRLGHAASNSAHIHLRAAPRRRLPENFSSHKVRNKANRKPEMHGHRGNPCAACTTIPAANAQKEPIKQAGRCPKCGGHRKQRRDGPQSRKRNSRTNHHGNRLSQLRLHPMLQNGHGSPPAKISILAEERSKARPWVIGDVGAWTQIDAIPGRDQPEIELGVLIVRESFVISSDGAKSLYVHQGVMAMIHKSSLCQPAVGRPSVAQLRILCRSRGFLETCHAPCGHAYNDRTRRLSFPAPQAMFHKSRRDNPHAHRPGSMKGARSPYCSTALLIPLLCIRRSLLRRTTRPSRREHSSTILNRSIRASAIRNDDLSNRARRFRREMIDNSLDVAFLVQTRNDDDGRRRQARNLI